MKRDELLDLLAGKSSATPCSHPTRVAIDGVDGAGKTTLADDLGRTLQARGQEVIRASIDSFHNPAEVRYRQGRDSPAGFFQDSYDIQALLERLLKPLGPGGKRRFQDRVFDWRTDQAVRVPPREASSDAILLLDGIFLHRPELRSCWDFGIFLEVRLRESLARNLDRARRASVSLDERAQRERFCTRYMPGQRIYLSSCNPHARASLVIDYNDYERPQLL